MWVSVCVCWYGHWDISRTKCMTLSTDENRQQYTEQCSSSKAKNGSDGEWKSVHMQNSGIFRRKINKSRSSFDSIYSYHRAFEMFMDRTSGISNCIFCIRDREALNLFFRWIFTFRDQYEEISKREHRIERKCNTKKHWALKMPKTISQKWKRWYSFSSERGFWINHTINNMLLQL